MKTLLILLLSLPFLTATAGELIIVGPEGAGDWISIRRPGPPQPPRPNWSPFALEVRSENVKVNIRQQTAVTNIDQVFYNPTSNQFEGYFLFPVPKGAVISNFSMFINGKEVQAELLDATKARTIYENIVRTMRDPALLEYGEQNLFKVRIFPIMPLSEQRVKISYTEVLPKDEQTFEYVYPLKTQQHAARPTQHVVVEVNIAADEPLRNVYCPTHAANVIHKGGREACVLLESRDLKSSTDLKVYFSTTAAAVGHSLLSYRKASEDGYFLLTLSPGIEVPNQQIVEKDITFVLDVSGSMAGEKMDKAKEALLFCVNNLNSGDRFNIIRFSTETRSLFDGLQATDKNHLDEARQFVKDLKPIGGTNIEEALQQALAIKPSANRPYLIVFITDGKPTIGATDEATILSKVKTNQNNPTRIFTVGIGNDLNSYLLDKITEQTQAYRTYIAPEEDIELKLSSFYTKINSPVLTNVRLTFDRQADIYDAQPSKNLPDLFKGGSLTVMGRYKRAGAATITLEGELNGQPQRYTFATNLDERKTDTDFIPPLWAARQVGYLLDQIRLNGENKELVDEVVRLAKQYGIITPYTSYLIMEDEPVVQLPPMPGPGPRPPQPPRPPRPPMPWESQRNESQREYDDMKTREGGGSIRASREVQDMNQATNMAQAKAGEHRMNILTDKGEVQNIATQYRNVQGKTLYNAGAQWIDAEVEKYAHQQAKRVAFASDAYFQLLSAEPEVAEYLSLGRNVQFVHNGQLYEVYE